MKKTARCLLPLGGALVCVCLPGLALAADPLRWKFAPGDEFTWTVSHRQDGKAKLATADTEFAAGTSTATYAVRYKVASVEGDAAELEMKIDRVQLKTKGPVDVDFDTANEQHAADPVTQSLAQAFGQLRSQTWKATVSLQGKLLKEEAAQPSGSSGPDGLPGILAVGVAGGFVPVTFDVVGLVWPELPESAPKVGDTWKQEATIASALGSKKVSVTYRYEGPDKAQKNQDQISFTCAIETNAAATGDAAKVKVGQHKRDGSFYFDNATGRIAAVKVNEHLEVDIAGQLAMHVSTDRQMAFGVAETQESAPANNPSEYRTWTNSKGQKIEAKALTREDGKIRIQRRDGKIFVLTLAKLSTADQKWVDDNLSGKEGAAKSPGESGGAGPAPGNPAATIAAGGKNWSSPESANFAGADLKTGDKFWIWPTKDIVVKAGNDGFAVEFNWALRPEANLEELQAMSIEGTLSFECKEAEGQSQTSSAQSPFKVLRTGKREGIGRIHFDGRRAKQAFRGKGEVVYTLQIKGEEAATTPCSNVIRQQIHFPDPLLKGKTKAAAVLPKE